MTDPIADFLTSIRNASQALKPEVEVGHSRMKESIAKILKREGYVAECSTTGDKIKTLKVKLKYEGRRGVIDTIKRVSTPGLRRYVGATEVPKVLGGMGTAILSTSKGIMTGVEARKNNLGGEIICFIW
jgi:small subunit ribosomal protein S8